MSTGDGAGAGLECGGVLGSCGKDLGGGGGGSDLESGALDKAEVLWRSGALNECHWGPYVELWLCGKCCGSSVKGQTGTSGYSKDTLSSSLPELIAQGGSEC